MSEAEIVTATRSGVGLFAMAHRGLLEVRGEDRVRWLDGMISGDVAALEKAASGCGCYATLLTHRGAIIADLHVVRIGERFLLETLRSAIPHVKASLERFIIADDVELRDCSEEQIAMALEGPNALACLGAAAGSPPGLANLEEDAWCEITIAECAVLVAAFGFSGERAFQLRTKPSDWSSVEAALLAAGKEYGLVRGEFSSLEILRVEAGIAVMGAELDESVLPPEARLERAISTTKGCYVGQEIVARLRARGQVNHLLVGLKLDVTESPAVNAKLSGGGRVIGELTSLAQSPTAGLIALGYVRREFSEVGREIELEAGRAWVAALPFVSSSSVDGADASAGRTDSDGAL